MKIDVLDRIPENEYDKEMILDVFTEKISEIIDEDIYNIRLKLNEKKEALKKKEINFEEIKRRSDEISKKYSREKQLSRVLSLLDTLKREGSIRGNNRIQMMKKMENIISMNFFKLRELEEFLSQFLPDTYGGKFSK